MLSFIRQNRNVLLVGLGVFMASMTALMFLLNQSTQNHGELKTDVLASEKSVVSEQSEEKTYREILNNTEDPVVVMSLDGTIQFNSSDFEKITGDPTDITKGKLFFSLLKPEDMGVFMSAFGKAIQTGKPQMMIGPYHILNRSGDYSVNMGSVYPLSENEKITKIGLTTRDISDKINNAEPSAQQDKPSPTKNVSNKKSENQNVQNDPPKDSSPQDAAAPQEILTQETEQQPTSDVKAQETVTTAQSDTKQLRIDASTTKDVEKPVAEQLPQPKSETDQQAEKIVSPSNIKDQSLATNGQKDEKVDPKNENQKSDSEVKKPETTNVEPPSNNVEQKKDHGSKWLKGDEIASYFWPWEFRFLVFPEHSLLARL